MISFACARLENLPVSERLAIFSQAVSGTVMLVTAAFALD